MQMFYMRRPDLKKKNLFICKRMVEGTKRGEGEEIPSRLPADCKAS